MDGEVQGDPLPDGGQQQRDRSADGHQATIPGRHTADPLANGRSRTRRGVRCALGVRWLFDCGVVRCHGVVKPVMEKP